jgi:hypothetical protein
MEESTRSYKGIPWEDFRLYFHLTRAVARRCTASRHATSVTIDTEDTRWEKLGALRAAASATTGNSENRSVSTGSQFY